MNKQESKYFNTALIFGETLIKLLEEKDIDYITVKEICDKAGFNRSTFYLHYDSINDLLNESVENIIQKLVNYYDINPKDFIANISNTNNDNLILISKEYLNPYLLFVKENKSILKAAYKHPETMKVDGAMHDLYKYVFNPILDKFEIKEDKRKYLISFYLNGIMGIIKEWVKNNCVDDIDYISDLILECVRP